ncbi:hypothetical protein [Sphingobacterium multivorum]|uniref:hypothetical protein n=1 Tax=Sphingobacterium multivorum TaxID=28454 RepID=UPI0028B0B1FD|nr:hypothetical protein [Sphingobacterium multivorum]
MAGNENNKRGRGRPSGSPNKITTMARMRNNRDLVKKEVSKKAGLFVVKQMDKLDDLYKDLTPSAKAKLLIELMKFSTTTYAEEMKLKHIEKENKGRDIKEIKISYEQPSLPEPIIEDVQEVQEVQDDSNIENENEDEADDIDFLEVDDEDEPF